MKQIPEKCKKAIAEQRCLGCVGLAEEDWIAPEKCPYIKTVDDCIKQIKLNLGMEIK